MIPLHELTEKIAAKLGAASLPSFIDNTVYNFAIFENEGEYRKPERNENTVTKYINAVTAVIGDEKTGINAQTLTYTVTTKIDFLIPDAAIEYEGESFGNAVIRAINAAFTLPDASTEVYDGVVYNIVGVYSVVTPGTKDIRPAVGESLTASAFVEWVITTQGYSSSNVKLYVDIGGGNYVQIFYSRLDINRSETQESNIGSNSDGIAKSVTSGSSFQISIIKPDRMDILDSYIANYLLLGDNTPRTYKLEWPVNITGGTLQTTKNTFDMFFRDAAKGAEGLDIPSNSCTLVEYMSLPTV